MLLPVKATLFLAQLIQLRELMSNSSISAYIVPLADAHNGERIAECDQRLKFISGFSGSAGSAIVTANDALLWTDGRYFTQAEKELETDFWTLMREGIPGTLSQADFLIKNLPSGARVGVDPALYPKSQWDGLESSLKVGGQVLVPIRENLIDLVWAAERPQCPQNPVFPLAIEFTGKTTADKLAEIRTDMSAENAEAVVLSELDEIAWLLNLRGSDLDSASVFISYLIILEDKFEFFIDQSKLNATVRELITADSGQIFDYNEITSRLQLLANSIRTKKIWFSNSCNYALVSLIPSERQIVKLTPLSLKKAVKNSVEVEGMRNALRKDAAAVARFLQWLEESMNNGDVISELSASAKLLEFREQNELFLTTSFNTISSTGSNGAIIHYRPTNESNTILSKEALYLVDSGAIYMDGTTDITRTVHFGTPTEYEKECYTRVLKGQIAIATSTFPFLLRGSRVDSFARRALWSVGLDYNHGTGHGIGHALNVHEGPSAIKERYVPDDQGLRENMFTSNEPGYYEEGSFGIRLENIVRVINVTLPYNFQNQGFLGFEDLTFVPYQHKLIKTELLTSTEINYLNDYQEKCRTIVSAFIEEQNPSDPAIAWIRSNTESLPLPSTKRIVR